MLFCFISKSFSDWFDCYRSLLRQTTTVSFVRAVLSCRRKKAAWEMHRQKMQFFLTQWCLPLIQLSRGAPRGLQRQKWVKTPAFSGVEDWGLHLECSLQQFNFLGGAQGGCKGKSGLKPLLSLARKIEAFIWNVLCSNLRNWLVFRCLWCWLYFMRNTRKNWAISTDE